MPTTRQFVLGLMAAVFGAIVTVGLRLSPAWIFGAMALILALVFVWLLRADPRARRGGPAIFLVTSFLLFELVLVLIVVGYRFRLWMVAALVLATLLASAMGFTQGRERRQIAMYVAIGLPVVLVPTVLLFVVTDVPFF
jgi:nitrate reductase NapE component